MAATPHTGIPYADELIALADAFGLTVTVETTDRETLTSYTVRISIPVPPAYDGTELGRAIAGDTLALMWTKAHRPGARGRLEDATAWTVDSNRKVRTQQRITTRVHAMGHQSAEYVRRTAPQIEDVVDAPHVLFIDGARRSSNTLSADFVRRIVRNRRHHGRPIHQDTDGAIVIENRRYAPDPAGALDPTVQERFHMRTVNGGTPERIPSADARQEMDNAMMPPGKRAVREMSASHGHARIVYRDNRGEVLLRPATSAETAAEQKPESERYAPGDRVIVRPVVYDPQKRTHRVFPEYTGTVVSWGSPHYYVRADETDEHGQGVRPCRVHELRPDPRCTGTAPFFADDQDVTATLAILTDGGHTLASLAMYQGGSNTDGAFVIPDSNDATPGVRVSYLIDGWSEESTTARKAAPVRDAERNTRNKALDSYAETLRAAGWTVTHAQATTTNVRSIRHLVIWPPVTVQA